MMVMDIRSILENLARILLLNLSNGEIAITDAYTIMMPNCKVMVLILLRTIALKAI